MLYIALLTFNQPSSRCTVVVEALTVDEAKEKIKKSLKENKKEFKGIDKVSLTWIHAFSTPPTVPVLINFSEDQNNITSLIGDDKGVSMFEGDPEFVQFKK